jgi:hypothetical protein
MLDGATGGFSINRDFADGFALTLPLSPREREHLRNRVECSGRPFAESRAEWSSLSRERAGVRADQAWLRFLGKEHAPSERGLPMNR